MYLIWEGCQADDRRVIVRRIIEAPLELGRPSFEWKGDEVHDRVESQPSKTQAL